MDIYILDYSDLYSHQLPLVIYLLVLKLPQFLVTAVDQESVLITLVAADSLANVSSFYFDIFNTMMRKVWFVVIEMWVIWVMWIMWVGIMRRVGMGGRKMRKMFVARVIEVHQIFIIANFVAADRP